MSQQSKLSLLKEMLATAEANIRSAKQIINELAEDQEVSPLLEMAATLSKSESEEGGHIIEGVFDGQKMIGPDKKVYSVPPNYASKSKLIPGDILKLTIKPDGAFVYKQIAPIDRKRIKGTLVYEEGEYSVLAEGKIYRVLLASVTYFKGNLGDEITLIIPVNQESEWGAIENVIPKDLS